MFPGRITHELPFSRACPICHAREDPSMVYARPSRPTEIREAGMGDGCGMGLPGVPGILPAGRGICPVQSATAYGWVRVPRRTALYPGRRIARGGRQRRGAGVRGRHPGRRGPVVAVCRPLHADPDQQSGVLAGQPLAGGLLPRHHGGGLGPEDLFPGSGADRARRAGVRGRVLCCGAVPGYGRPQRGHEGVGDGRPGNGWRSTGRSGCAPWFSPAPTG